MQRDEKHLLLFLCAVLALALPFCKKKNEHLSLIPVTEYYPLEVGKYIIYKMDSMVFENYGIERRILSRQVRDLVDAEITDNNNRKSYRIRRMMRNANGTGEWVDNSTFMVTPLANSIEIVDNNLRFIKLKAPVRDSASWRGNSYINAVDDLQFMDYWDYKFQDVGRQFTVPAGVVENSATVRYFSAVSNPIIFPGKQADSTYSLEVYGQGIGLIYKDFVHWVYRPRYELTNCKYIKCKNNICDTIVCSQVQNCDSLKRVDTTGRIVCDTLGFRYAYEGFGVKMAMLEHN